MHAPYGSQAKFEHLLVIEYEDDMHISFKAFEREGWLFHDLEKMEDGRVKMILKRAKAYAI